MGLGGAGWCWVVLGGAGWCWVLLVVVVGEAPAAAAIRIIIVQFCVFWLVTDNCFQHEADR